MKTKNYIADKSLLIKECKNKSKEICNECGKDVSEGSGLFANRIIDFDNIIYRKTMGKPFYKGNFICIKCDMKIRDYSI